MNVMLSPQPPKNFSVLVADDEPALRKVIRTSLAANGFLVQEAGTGSEAVDAVKKQPFDIVLMDVNMPEMSGFEACEQIRMLAPRSGIVMVTVRDSEEDKVRALESGADDYITKPFRIRELMARLGSVLRRIRVLEDADTGMLRAGHLKLHVEKRRLWKRGEEVRLSPTEFELLAFLMENQGVLITHIKLLRAVWGPDYGDQVNYLRSYVRMIRKKIEDDPAMPVYLLTEASLGYRFHNPSDTDRPVDPKNS